MDGTGHTVIAEYEPTVETSVSVADKALADFLADCVKTHGNEPPVWARRVMGTGDFDLFDPNADNLVNVEEVVIHQPLIGG